MDVRRRVNRAVELHLAVPVRSFRAESVSQFVAAILDGEAKAAATLIDSLRNYPLVMTRDLNQARNWLRSKARGTERFGLVASSNALRLKPVGIHVTPNLAVC